MGGIEVAVVAAAGAGTRMWPATRVVPKELFPIGRLPALAHLLVEFHEAGLSRAIVVANERLRPLLRELLDPDGPVPERAAGTEEARRFLEMARRFEVEIVAQSGPYGNGTPLLNALDALGGPRDLVYAFGDDVVLGENATASLLEVHRATGGAVLACQEVPEERRGAFGIVETRPERGFRRVVRLVEKPAPGETESRLAAFGRYVVTRSVVEALAGVGTGRGGEVWFTDAVVARLRAGEAVWAQPLCAGRWVTVGDPAGYAEAVARAARLRGAAPGGTME